MRRGRNTMHRGATKVSTVIDDNLEALIEKQRQEQSELSLQTRIAGAITRFAGSMAFVYLHLFMFGTWILVNLNMVPFVKAFDPSLVMLAMIASVEAIFVSTFVLISQNRMAGESEKRAELALQISLLNEHETTRIISMLSAIAEHLGISTDLQSEEIEELKQDVSPEAVLNAIEERKED
jgi:uncharacterized membrane protein